MARTLPPKYGGRVFSVLGVRVNAVQIPDVVAQTEDWIADRSACQYITVTGMHGVTEAQHDSQFKQILNSAGLVVPDGYPLVWLGRRTGLLHLRRRVYGPELMEEFFRCTAAKGYRHFFYGGAPGIADELATRMSARFAGLAVVGTYCPPFRELTPREDEGVLQAINLAKPDVVWVGLSTPKQERWMYLHRTLLNVPVLVGVGAAFDFHTGRVPQAPGWMREHGLEWLYRLCREPRRLWRRYLVYGSQFVVLVLLELLHLRKFR